MITGFFEHNRESETVGYVIKKDGTVFSYKFEGFDGGLPVKIGNLVKNDPDEFHLNYDHENYTEVFRFDENNNLTLINAWVSDKGTREDNYKFPDIFKKVRRMGQAVLENYNGFDARLGALTRDFNIVEKRQLEDLREKLKELNLVWKQNCEEEESIRDKVQEILVEQLGKRDEQIAPEVVTLEAKSTEDLGMDSLELVELAMALEEEFGKEIPGEEAEKLESLGDAVRFIEGLHD